MSLLISKASKLMAILVGATLLALTALAAAGCGARARLTNDLVPPGAHVDVDGRKLHLDCRGSGPVTVVLEAGLNDFSLHWHEVQGELARSTRVCSYDRAGLGFSDPSPRPATAEQALDDLEGLLAGAGITGPLLLVGHSSSSPSWSSGR